MPPPPADDEYSDSGSDSGSDWDAFAGTPAHLRWRRKLTVDEKARNTLINAVGDGKAWLGRRRRGLQAVIAAQADYIKFKVCRTLSLFSQFFIIIYSDLI